MTSYKVEFGVLDYMGEHVRPSSETYDLTVGYAVLLENGSRMGPYLSLTDVKAAENYFKATIIAEKVQKIRRQALYEKQDVFNEVVGLPLTSVRVSSSYLQVQMIDSLWIECSFGDEDNEGSHQRINSTQSAHYQGRVIKEFTATGIKFEDGEEMSFPTVDSIDYVGM